LSSCAAARAHLALVHVDARKVVLRHGDRLDPVLACACGHMCRRCVPAWSGAAYAATCTLPQDVVLPLQSPCRGCEQEELASKESLVTCGAHARTFAFRAGARVEQVQVGLGGGVRLEVALAALRGVQRPRHSSEAKPREP
jgi:hypothetical protein